mmetsp:Transcript_6761/g.14556  ORF Transcript_6761/g.14556 Transcript_6761/m.14556 type:complete len:216 (-) Transcript_6761:805-1452(-)
MLPILNLFHHLIIYILSRWSGVHSIVSSHTSIMHETSILTGSQLLPKTKKMLANDLVGWMETIAKERDTEITAVPFQYEAFVKPPDWSVESAIKLVLDGPILVLIKECFDESLRILAEKKPQFFSRRQVDSFLTSSASKANLRQDSPSKSSTNVTNVDMEALRERHKKWFPDEWKFYSTILQQFESELLASKSIDKGQILSCRQRIKEQFEIMSK